MKKAFIFVLLTAIFVCGIGAHGGGYEQGKNLYEEKCQICHGVNGQGDGPAAAALTPSPTDFARPDFWQGDVESKITETVQNGHAPMPAFNLKPDEIKAIIEYMTHSFKK